MSSFWCLWVVPGGILYVMILSIDSLERESDMLTGYISGHCRLLMRVWKFRSLSNSFWKVFFKGFGGKIGF